MPRPWDPAPPSRPGFAVRRLDELVPRRPRRDWDVRFVSATLLFYGLMGAAFFLVDWLNPTPDEPVPIAASHDATGEGARQPYLVRLPGLLKERAAVAAPPESR
ncbi:MAG: hypothetical protein KIT36_14820 [Alphaproteobacteria bacterium]|nr:hypothetical protein [Alphaproteobacteria bacterium]